MNRLKRKVLQQDRFSVMSFCDFYYYLYCYQFLTSSPVFPRIMFFCLLLGLLIRKVCCTCALLKKHISSPSKVLGFRDGVLYSSARLQSIQLRQSVSQWSLIQTEIYWCRCQCVVNLYIQRVPVQQQAESWLMVLPVSGSHRQA